MVRLTPRTPPGQTQHLRKGHVLPSHPLHVLFHISDGGLFRHGTDGARPERLPGTENDLRVFVGITLVFSGEVQVDIRLLVSLETKERLERNIKSFLI